MNAIPSDLYQNLERDVPIALLPVRLEMRFGDRPIVIGTQDKVMPVLRLRIFPDDISVDAHKADLTRTEAEAGADYWSACAKTDSSEARFAVWQALCARVGDHRAAHVAAVTQAGALSEHRQGSPAPTAALLPTRWLATVWVGGQRVIEAISNPVRAPLALGPEQQPDGKIAVDPKSPTLLDEATKWLVDFNEAEAAGMAMTIDLSLFDDHGVETPIIARTQKIERLFVFGLREDPGQSPETEANALAEHFEKHRLTRGAKFLPQGAPTNNLRGRRTSWRSRPDPAKTQPREAPAAAPAYGDILAGGGDNGATLAAALGMPADTFRRLDGATLREQTHARNMNEAMFAVTWGELIGTLLLPGVVSSNDEQLIDQLDDAYDFARSHFRDFVRGRGPLPTLLLGRQPYGVLPITAPTSWAPQSGDDPTLARLATLLRRLRPIWEHAANAGALAAAPANLDDASRRFAAQMGLGPAPHPESYGVRTFTGELASIKYRSLEPNRVAFAADGKKLDARSVASLVSGTQAQVYRRLLGRLANIPMNARFFNLEMQEAQLLTLPAATENGDKSPAEYLSLLGQATWKQLQQATPWGGAAPQDLLYQLALRTLRLANEQSIFGAIRKGAHWDGLSEKLRSVPVELGQFATPGLGMAFSLHLSELAAKAELPQEIAHLSLPEVVVSRDLLSHFPGPFAVSPRSKVFIDAQCAIKALGDAALEAEDYARLLGETLATCSARLDAWTTSLATQRLHRLRDKRPKGLRIGAYGWLVNLPEWASSPKPIEKPPAGVADDALPLVAPRHRVDWVHAPSLAQAETAAILRSAELNHGGDENGAEPARFDLTSTRIRMAAHLLDAAHNGQPLGAVLGYRLERMLQDTGAARFIRPLREAYPRRGLVLHDGSAPPEAAVEQVVPDDVVDGEQVWRAWRNWKADPKTPLSPGIAPIMAEMGASVMTRLDALMDSISDLLLAEGVHNIVAGNHGRAAATLNAIAQGDPPPADLDVIRTPRSGVQISHRLMLLLDDADSGIPGWSDDAPRARLCKSLEHWARRLLGSPDRWVIALVKSHPEDRHDAEVTRLSALPGLCALDVLMEATAAGAPSPLADRVIASADKPGYSVAQPVKLAEGEFGWAQLTALAGAARDLLAQARPADGQDWISAHESAPPVDDDWGLDDLTGRFAAALDQLGSVMAETPIDAQQLTPHLEILADFGIASAATPASAENEVRIQRAVAALAAAQRVKAAVDHAATAAEKTKKDANQAAEGGTDPSEKARVTLYQSRTRLHRQLAIARALLGPSTLIVPSVAPAAAVLTGAPPLNVSSGDIADWLRRTARVRPAAAALQDLMLFSSVVNGATIDAEVRQLPLRDNDGWLGGPLKPLDGAPNPLRPYGSFTETRTHLAMVGHVEDAAKARAVMLDEWNELIPATTQTTGLSLYYDAPNARAPQSILLAAHPDPQNAALPWSGRLLEDMLADTLSLARLRTVEIEQLAPTALDEFLPAIYARDGLPNTTPIHNVADEFIKKFGRSAIGREANLDYRAQPWQT